MVTIRDESRGVEQGKRYGWLVVLGKPFHYGCRRDFSVVVKCDCGEVFVRPVAVLKKTTSNVPTCDGCQVAANYESHPRLKKIWRSMLSRCGDPRASSFKDYGGRGIEVCVEWKGSYESFKEWSLSNHYAGNLQIDRRNNDGNYEPENCRWITPRDNTCNRRTTRYIEAFGEIRCLADWVADERCTVTLCGLRERLQRGMPAERAITTPSRVKAVPHKRMRFYGIK